MNSRSPIQPYLSNSHAIRQEIQRFESVHPSIYAIYDLIEAIPNPLIQQQIREHVVCIEDSFVNSQEWTLSRTVPDLKLGILGSVQSGKSALVHRYLTGSYMQEESPEGGRFKKEVIIDGQSYLLLIRDEGGSPELQFSHWVDAVIFVFSLENEESFKAVYSHFAEMAHHRNTTEIPLILVGTQDAISESNPRVIDDTRARKLASDLKRCTYYETCATYGLNVERVFQDACQKIVQSRYPSIPHPVSNVPSTPNHSQRSGFFITQTPVSKPYDTHSNSSQSTSSSGTLVTGSQNSSAHSLNQQAVKDALMKEKELREKSEKTERKKEKLMQQQQPQAPPPLQIQPDPEQADFMDIDDITACPPPSSRKHKRSNTVTKSNSFSGTSELRQQLTNSNITPILNRKNRQFHKANFLSGRRDRYTMELQIHSESLSNSASVTQIRGRSSLVLDKNDSKDLPTPSSTPTQSRKNRRRSNLFNPKKPEEEKKPEGETLGSGRVIPLKQGYLYKKSHGLNKDWKKKYVALLDDGRLTYHPNLHDYMEDSHGKEIPLMRTTVKLPGLRPRGSRGTQMGTNGLVTSEMNNLSIGGKFTPPKLPGKGRPANVSKRMNESVVLTGYGVLKDRNANIPKGHHNYLSRSFTSGTGLSNGTGEAPRLGLSSSSMGSKNETPLIKKRHRRAKSGGIKTIDPGGGDDSDGYEFYIVSIENKQWHFEAQSPEERDDWVNAIEQQILCSLQSNESIKSKSMPTCTDPAGIQATRNVRGNNCCADCGAPSPDWASINLGALICIECSGIHRNLGTHLSRVRSLDLDEWPPDLIHVMTSIGNYVANSVWEANTKGRPKPGPSASRDDKEKWIRAKYEQKEYLPPPPYIDIPIHQQLIDALVREDIKNIILILGHATTNDINSPYSKDDGRTALHIASALGNVVFVQLLLWYNANVKVIDHEGRNALWYARSSGSGDCVELLQNNGCPEHPTLPRRRGSSQPQKSDMFDKLPASVI